MLTSVSHVSCHLPLLPVLLTELGSAAQRGTGKKSWRDKAGECPLEWLPLFPWRLGPGFMVADSSRNALPSWVFWLVGNIPGLVCPGSQGLALGWPKASSRGWALGEGQDGHRSPEKPGSSGDWRPSGFPFASLTWMRCQWEETRQMEKTKRFYPEPGVLSV